MKKNNFNDVVINKIMERIPEAPHDWAKQIAKIMGKTEVSIYAYARGERGLRRGYPLEVLRHLNKMIERKQKQMEELTA